MPVKPHRPAAALSTILFYVASVGRYGPYSMTGNSAELTTLDRFLGGRLVIEQFAQGYRAAIDPVFLAARAGEVIIHAAVSL